MRYLLILSLLLLAGCATGPTLTTADYMACAMEGKCRGMGVVSPPPGGYGAGAEPIRYFVPIGRGQYGVYP